MLIDAAMIAGCIGAAFAWKYQDSETPENLIHVYLIPLSILLRWLFYGYFNLYDFSRQETLLDQIYYLFWCNCLASGIEWLGLLVAKAYYLGDAAGVSREMILTSWALILAASSLWRGVFFHARRTQGRHIHRVAIAGTGEAAQKVYEEIKQFGGEEIQLAGYIVCQSGEQAAQLPVIGSLDTLERALREHRIDDLILAPDSSGQPEPMEWIVRCERVAPSVRVRLHSDLAGLYAGRVTLTDLAGLPLVEIPDRWRHGWQLALKRTLDIAASSAGLILLFLPGLAVALAIALEGLFRPAAQGPVFFCQERMGRHRKLFRLVKFRTMISSAEAGSGPILASKNDPRITRIGRVLRRSGIDELPQLWNVLKGEMSLVGPRPERPEFTEQFFNEHPYYELRLRMRPGITGLAQIHGHYHSPVSSKLRYDIVYLSNFSLLLDLKILFRTLQVILTGKKIEGR